MVALLWKHRDLAWELTKRDLADRYVGQWLGLFWVVAHPLVMVAVYVFIFAGVLGPKLDLGANLPAGEYLLYLLAGLLPWLAFQDVMGKSCGAVIGHTSLVKQVVFPTEVLPVKSLALPITVEIVGLSALLVYTSAKQGHVIATWALVPALLLVQAVAMIGVSYILSSVSVFVRDVKDVVQVFGMIGVYLVPVVYLPTWLPEWSQPLLWLNPFSSMVWCYQDALFYGHFEHPLAWIMFPGLSIVVFISGGRVFQHLKVWFGNVL